ncbi:hypothetical protein Ancab_010987 [Ancistrocladus abbreviatus]
MYDNPQTVLLDLSPDLRIYISESSIEDKELLDGRLLDNANVISKASKKLVMTNDGLLLYNTQIVNFKKVVAFQHQYTTWIVMPLVAYYTFLYGMDY